MLITPENILVFCGGFFCAVIALTVIDVVDKDAPRGASSATFGQGGWMLLLLIVSLLVGQLLLHRS